MRLLSLLLGVLFASFPGMGQSCKSLSLVDYDQWKDVAAQKISDDGKYVLFELRPQKGDGELIVFELTKQKSFSIPRGSEASFLPEGKGLIYKIKPPRELIRKQQLDGKKADQLTKDSLGVKLFIPDTTLLFADVKSYKMPEKKGNLIAWQFEEKWKPTTDSIVSDSTQNTRKTAKKPKSKYDIKKSWLGVLDLITMEFLPVQDVYDYRFSEQGRLFFLTHQLFNLDSTRVMMMNSLESKTPVFELQGLTIQLASDKAGMQSAFLTTTDTTSRKLYTLWHVDVTKMKAHKAVDTTQLLHLSSLCVSENFGPQFSDDGQALYFGLGMKPRARHKDTLTADEKVSVDIWNWKDGQLQSQQLKNADRERKRSFFAVYYPQNKRFVALADEDRPEVRADYKNHPDWFLSTSNKPYEHLSSWEQVRYSDVYLVNRKSGEVRLLLKKAASAFLLSPDASHLLFYEISDSSWKSLNVNNKQVNVLASGRHAIFYDRANDIPRPAPPVGFAGWANNQTAMVHSHNGIWELDITGKKQPKPLFNVPDDLIFRYLNLNREETFMPAEIFMSFVNQRTKASGFATFNNPQQKLEIKILEDARFSNLIKAKDVSKFIYRKETFSQYPDIYFTGDSFIESQRISHANPQQDAFCWGFVQAVSWKSFEGDSLNGLLYFPANFDQSSKYPMIVYFYETHSDDLHRHITPRPSRSVINIAEYTSRGYFVFTPDIVYSTGTPGRSAYASIMSGVTAMTERFAQIDKERLGLQGQSWGGYQVAWLITQTNLFKAAMAGAPVSNMTSAYGQIRWESGMSRAFQYEEGQSRIGGSLWENLRDYIENSPLFFADRVQTPLLMMHNDNDGAVPWYQGIEYFTALRRLSKPVWMLVYNNGPHNLSRRADSEDLTMRLQQFFDHFLKDQPEPEWMKNGVPAIEKGFNKGF